MATTKIQNILVPIFCNQEVEMLLKQAMYFNEVFSSRITLLNVVPKSSFIKRVLQSKKNDPLAAEKEAVIKLTNCASQYFNQGIPEYIALKTVSGGLVTEILKMLKACDFDLIIIKQCSKIKSLLSKLKIDSQKIVSGTECPVMIIHEKWTKVGIKEILVPIDITQKCKNVVLWAAANLTKAASQDTNSIHSKHEYQY